MNKLHNREAQLWIIIMVLSLALLLLFALNLWGLRLFGTVVDYTRFGNWSDAISGIGTTAAVIVALAASYMQRTSQRATEAAEQFEAEVAIFQWLTSKEVLDENTDQLIGRLWDIKIQNSTVAPIYRWKVVFVSTSDHICNFLKRPLLPGENVFNLPFLDDIEPTKAPEPSLIFEGRSGQIWRRSARGVVEQDSDVKLGCEHSS